MFPCRRSALPATSLPPAVTLEAAEREHILRTLRDTKWIIAGPNGAAARLGMKRTTLQSRMTKSAFAARPKQCVSGDGEILPVH